MPEGFFELGRRSRCIFTPTLWCNLFAYDTQDGGAAFFNKIAPQTVGVFLPTADGEAGQHWDDVYAQIVRAWGDRRIGFQCYRADMNTWIAQQPCESCAMSRLGQVVIIDVSDEQLRERVEIYRTLAAASATMLSLEQASGGVQRPAKKIILIHAGGRVPSYYSYTWDVIDYTGQDNLPDLDRLYREMARLAQAGDLFPEAGHEPVRIDLSDIGEPAAPAEPSSQQVEDALDEPVVRPVSLDDQLDQAIDDAFSSDDDITITIIGTEAMQAETIGSVAAGNDEQADLELARRLGLPPDLIKQLQYPIVVESIRLYDAHDYSSALRHLYDTGKLTDQDWESHRRWLLRNCLDILPVEEVVAFFFEPTVPQGVRGRLKLSDWQTRDPLAATLSIRDARLNDLLEADEIPLRVYPDLTPDDVVRWYSELSTRHPNGAAAMLVFTTGQEIPTGIRLLEYRDGRPPIHFIKFELADLKKSIIDHADPVGVVSDHVERHYHPRDRYDGASRRTVETDDEFFGRHELIEDLIAQLKEGNSFAVSGLRRTGKSSLLKRLRYVNTLGDHILLLVDLQHSPGDITIVYRSIVRQVRDTLQRKYPPARYPRDSYPALDFDRLPLFKLVDRAMLTDFGEHFSTNMAQLLNDLRETAELGFRKLIVLFDEIDELLPDQQGIDRVANYRTLLKQLRTLAQKREGFMIGMVSSGLPLRKELDDISGPLYRQIKQFHLAPLSRSECDEMVEKLGKPIPIYYREDGLEAIYQATGGIPFLAKRLCSAIFQERQQQSLPVSKDDVMRGIERIFTDDDDSDRNWIRDVLDQINEISEEEYAVLELIAAGRNASEPATLDWLLDSSALDQNRSLKPALASLSSYGLIDHDQRDPSTYYLRVGLLREYLLRYE